MEEKRKYRLFAILLGVILIPFAQKLTRLVPEHPLDGKQELVARPEWSWSAWKDGSYQEQANWHYTQEAGFRNAMVRTNNQLYYSLYGVPKANDVVLGEKGYLFSNTEVREFVTPYRDTAGFAASLMDSLKFVQDRLRSDGKEFLMVVVPNKVIVYPEFMPSRSGTPTDQPRYAAMIAAARDKQIPLLDLTTWYKDLRHRIPYPVYTRGAMHWSVAGQAYALDTILQVMSARTGTAFPKLRIDTVTWSPVPLYEDNDLARGLNLLCTPSLDSTPYPKVTFEGPPRSRVLFAADSYYDHIYHHYSDSIFERSSYWFYVEDLHNKVDGMTLQKDVSVRQQIEQHDLVVLLLSTNNIEKMPRNFLRKFHAWYASSEYRVWKINSFIEGMKADQAWTESLKLKAVEHGVPLDTMMRRDAEYLWKMGK